jgi:hypothetical protein
MPRGKPYAKIIGITTKLLIIVTTMLANTAVAGNMILGKKTRCIILVFPDRQVTEDMSDLPKQLHTITPIKTQTA